MATSMARSTSIGINIGVDVDLDVHIDIEMRWDAMGCDEMRWRDTTRHDTRRDETRRDETRRDATTYDETRREPRWKIFDWAKGATNSREVEATTRSHVTECVYWLYACFSLLVVLYVFVFLGCVYCFLFRLHVCMCCMYVRTVLYVLPVLTSCTSELQIIICKLKPTWKNKKLAKQMAALGFVGMFDDLSLKNKHTVHTVHTYCKYMQ